MNTLRRIFPILLICLSCFTGRSQIRNISVSLCEESDSVKFVLHNNAGQPLWLFDSYLDPKYGDVLFQSPYLHRVDRKTNRFKLSFLPVSPWLSLNHSDLIIRNRETIRYPGQVVYHFRKMAEKDSLEVAIPKEAFLCEEYVIDRPLTKYHYYDAPHKVKFRTATRRPQQSSRTVEFALFQSLNGINENNYYYNWLIFDEAVKGYGVLAVTIDIDSWDWADE